TWVGVPLGGEHDIVAGNCKRPSSAHLFPRQRQCRKQCLTTRQTETYEQGNVCRRDCEVR
ncbi:MAG: hypothetical protein VX035_13940, partial [Planctomycetota bacterium]|nr:hypothetical protein [Planctomycetota bacterium]